MEEVFRTIEEWRCGPFELNDTRMDVDGTVRTTLLRAHPGADLQDVSGR